MDSRYVVLNLSVFCNNFLQSDALWTWQIGDGQGDGASRIDTRVEPRRGEVDLWWSGGVKASFPWCSFIAWDSIFPEHGVVGFRYVALIGVYFALIFFYQMLFGLGRW